MAQDMLQQAMPAATTDVVVDDFAMLLQKEFKPNNDLKQARIEQAVKTLAQQALEDAAVIGEDVYLTVDALKAAIAEARANQRS